MQINASIVWWWTRYHEIRRPTNDLRHLTSSDSICCPALSLVLILIMRGAIYINPHWLERPYQVSRPWKYFENMFLLSIVSRPASTCSGPVGGTVRYCSHDQIKRVTCRTVRFLNVHFMETEEHKAGCWPTTTSSAVQRESRGHSFNNTQFEDVTLLYLLPFVFCNYPRQTKTCHTQ